MRLRTPHARFFAGMIFAAVSIPSLANAESAGVNENVDAGVMPVGYLPPTHEGSVRLLLRTLTAHTEDGIPLNAAPVVRVHAGRLAIGCDTPTCENGGTATQSIKPDALDPAYIGIVIDDTLALRRTRALGDEICEALRATSTPNAAYSAWRIGDSTGSASLGAATRSIDELCAQFDGLTGLKRDARSPILQVIDDAVSSMASETQLGTRRELLVITDGVDETCVGASDLDRCADEKLQLIRERATANSIPISILHVDTSRSAASVALHEGDRVRRLGRDTNGIVRSIPARSTGPEFISLLSRQLDAINSVAYATVECLATSTDQSHVGIRLARVEEDDLGERIASIAVQRMSVAPLLCDNQPELCQLATGFCKPSTDIIARIRARQTGVPTSIDDDGANTESETATGSEKTSNRSTRVVLLVLAALMVLLALILMIRARRKKPSDDEPPTEPTVRSGIPADRGTTVSSVATSFDNAAPTVNAGRTVVESTAHFSAPFEDNLPRRITSQIGRLRDILLHQDGPHVGMLTSSGQGSFAPISTDEWTRLTIDPDRGLAAAHGANTQLLLRYDSGSKAIQVRVGSNSDDLIYVNRQLVSAEGASALFGDVLHYGAQKTPLDLRQGRSAASHDAVLVPEGSNALGLPEISVGPEETVIGRDPEPEPGWEAEFAPSVRLPIDSLAETQRRKVSSDHLTVWSSGGALMLRDTSSNGTLINGAKVPTNVPMTLRSGDQIRISHEISYRVKASS